MSQDVIGPDLGFLIHIRQEVRRVYDGGVDRKNNPSDRPLLTPTAISVVCGDPEFVSQEDNRHILTRMHAWFQTMIFDLTMNSGIPDTVIVCSSRSQR